MKLLRALLQLAACAAILYGAWLGVQRILATEPKAQREGASRKTAMLVELAGVTQGTFEPEIVVLGRVRPAREIQLRAQVSGRVISRADGFTPGGLVDEQQVLLALEEADFDNTVRQRKSAWDQAEADLQVELGRQEVAKRDFAMLESEMAARLDEKQRRLALREPQVEAARARVASAKAAWDQAKLDLERAKVRAPFAAQVLTRDADLGSRVSPGDDLGHLVGVETYWIVANVPLKSLRWVDLGKGDARGAVASIRNRAAWPEGTYRTGRVLRLIGSLDQTTRLAKVLIEVKDPLALETKDENVPPLILDAIVEVRITSRPLEDVVQLARDHLRMGDTVWTMEPDGTLRIRPVEVIFRNEGHAYIRAGLPADARVVTTNLATVVNGAPLRTGAEDGSDTPKKAAAPAKDGAE